jgi:hypothetical protein
MPVDDRLWQEFHDAVNMTSRELQDWLQTARTLDLTAATPATTRGAGAS